MSHDHLNPEQRHESPKQDRTSGPVYRPYLAEVVFHSVSIAAPDGSLIYCNSRWQEITGLSPRTALEAGLEGRVHHEDLPRLKEPGAGSTFYFTVAVPTTLEDTARRPFPEAQSQQLTSVEPATDATPAPRLEILVADDDPVNLKLTSAMLTGLGHQVTHVCKDNEAVDSAQARQFDLILMDIQMSGMSGADAARRIRGNQAAANFATPIIAMTAHPPKPHHPVLVISGIDAHISKPFKREDLVRVVTEYENPQCPRLHSWEELVSQFEGDTELVEELITLSLQHSTQLIEGMLAAMAAADAAALGRNAHSMKSTIGSWGAEGVLEVAAAVEAAGRHRDLTNAALALSSLDRELAMVHRALRTYLQKAQE